MNNLINLYNNKESEQESPLFLSFTVGESKYALPAELVVEIIKLPLLDYPQKLPNNIVGLLNYNNFTLNVLDIRFYLNIKVTPYNTSNQLLIVKTDEAFLGLIINRVEDIISLDSDKIERMSFQNDEKLIDFLYRQKDEALAVLNLYSLENLLKKGVPNVDIDIPALFPQDDESRYKLMQRNKELAEKNRQDLVKNIFTQDKFISFLLNDNMYCLNLNTVKEFLKNPVITPVPGTPNYIVGLITLRGDFLTIINIKNFLELGANSTDSENYARTRHKNRIIIIETENFQVGLLVDEIFGIIDIPEDLMAQSTHRQPNKYILGEVILEEKFYNILDIKNILSDERLYIEEN